MKAALDVHYETNRAIAACVAFNSWSDSAPAELIRVDVPYPAQYRSGRFYERELPCLLSVLNRASQEFSTIIIDGYVHLAADVGKGLGWHLYESLPYSPVIIGVAKNPLKVAEHFLPVYRARSRKPLFVSAIGCPIEQAAQSILRMDGPYRIPTLLRLADQYARGIYQPD